MLHLTDLKAFARIAELGSVSAAARSLRSPKSSVSRSLARLEASVGASLIERSTRSLRLTDAGLLLHRHARRILDDVGEAENALGGLVGVPRGDLRVSVPFTFAAGPLALMLPGFMKRYPEVRVVLSIDNRPVDLLVDEIDLAIRIGRLPDSELIARRLARFELWPCATPAYLAARGVPAAVDDLRHHTLIAHVDRRGPQRFRTPTGEMLDAADALASGTLVRVLADHPADSVEAHALYPSHRSLSAKVRVFIDALVAHLAAAR